MAHEPPNGPLPTFDADLARRLVAGQFPQWADRPVTPVDLDGWDNRTFRLGDDLTVRMPSGDGYALQVDKEHRWLPYLAPRLPLPIPEPVARGVPAAGYPYAWSVYRWLPGRPASAEAVADRVVFATDLAAFLLALQRIDAADGPAPGPHNFFRGAPLATYAEETYVAVDNLGPEVDRDAVLPVFEDALTTTWSADPVWVHGDVATGNLLLREGRLGAVIDFGCAGVGDPACDLVIAWTFLTGPSRLAFRRTLGVDHGTWSRGRGWALWKALITFDRNRGDAAQTTFARTVIDEAVRDHAVG